MSAITSHTFKYHGCSSETPQMQTTEAKKRVLKKILPVENELRTDLTNVVDFGGCLVACLWLRRVLLQLGLQSADN